MEKKNYRIKEIFNNLRNNTYYIKSILYIIKNDLTKFDKMI